KRNLGLYESELHGGRRDASRACLFCCARPVLPRSDQPCETDERLREGIVADPLRQTANCSQFPDGTTSQARMLTHSRNARFGKRPLHAGFPTTAAFCRFDQGTI